MTASFALPLQLGSGGSFATLAQDTAGEIAQSVAVLMSTRPGERRAVPEYGLPDPLFGGASVDDVVEVIAEWEPRASPALVESVITGATQSIDIRPGGGA